MLLRASISSTKKFFQKTLSNFKSFFSNSYHRLPKAAAPPFAADPKMDKDSTFPFTSSQNKVQNGSFTKKNNDNNPVQRSNTIVETEMKKVEKNQERIKIGATHQRKAEENCESSSKSTTLYEYDERRMCLVVKKIKELQKLDARNVDHALDIEEVLHYYSRLTCPTYLQIVDKFFMDIFAEFCSSSSFQQNCSAKPIRRLR